MIKILRKKFIRTAKLAVTVLLILLLEPSISSIWEWCSGI